MEAGKLHGEGIAVVKIQLEAPQHLSRLEPVVRIRDVVDTALVDPLPDEGVGRGPGAEAGLYQAAAEVLPSQEAGFRIEILSGSLVIQEEPVSIGVVIELRPVVDVVALQAICPGLGKVPADVHVFVEGQVRVEAPDGVGARRNGRDRPVGEDSSDAARP